jgi:hypothetical protein
MSATSLVLTFVLLVAGIVTYARTLWSKDAFDCVLGLAILTCAGITAAVNAALSSL